MFYVRFDKLAAARSGNSAILFQLELDNPADRTATILSCDFELWALIHGSSEAKFLGRLSPDLHGGRDWQRSFGPNEARPFPLTWHCTPERLQHVEDCRAGGDLTLEIRGYLGVAALWPKRDSSLQVPSFASENPFLATLKGGGGSYPIRIAVAPSQWAELLGEIGFRHITLYELPIPPLPPGFSRSETYLKEAWIHHRSGRKDEALLACRKAFEPLGYNLFGDDRLSRRGVLDRLMSGEATGKREAILDFWEKLQDLLSKIGVHEKGEPIDLTYADTELAVICTTALLGYLAKQQ